MIRAGIVGATGYAGAELVKILVNHPSVEIAWLDSKSYAGSRFSDIYPNMRGICDLVLEPEDIEGQADRADVIFTATPQGYLSQRLNEKILEKCKVIDISADYRIKDVDTYEEWYGIKHGSPEFIDEAVYGLVEINRDKITQDVRLIANPGCYTTCSILGMYPLVKAGVVENDTIIIDAKSGTSGAGRSAKTANLYCEVNESFKAYGAATHRHTPEIEEQLGYAAGEEIVLNFTPHLVPMDRGILATEYANLKVREDGSIPTGEEIAKIYEDAYGKEHFIRFLGEGVYPETRAVKGSNYVDIGFVIDKRTGRIIVMSAIDNLVKGAAGQAVQNMNLLFGLPETTGLNMVPLLP